MLHHDRRPPRLRLPIRRPRVALRGILLAALLGAALWVIAIAAVMTALD